MDHLTASSGLSRFDPGEPNAELDALGPRVSAPTMVIGGCDVHLATEESVLSAVSRAAARRDGPCLAIASANLDHVHHFGSGGASRDLAMQDTAELTWLTLLDGAPLVACARRATGTQWPRLAGSDLLMPLLRRADQEGARVGFLGGMPPMLDLLRERLERELPQLKLVGMWSPSREELSDPAASRELAQKVAREGADILVVGLGKPRQEQWIQSFGPATGARALLAFGASADFLAGTVSRAPTWMRDHGVEWAYRLAVEPRRLARRYLRQGPPALLKVLRSHHATDTGQADRSKSRRPREIGSLAAVIVTYNSENEIGHLLGSLQAAASGLSLTTIVVDNDSSDRSVSLARADGSAVVVESGSNLGFAGAFNLAMGHLSAAVDAVAVLNPDLVLSPESLTRLAAALADPAVGVAVPTVLEPGGTRFPSLRREPTVLTALGDAAFGSRLRRRSPSLSDIEWDPAAYERDHDVDWASGAAWVIARDCLDEVGEWNPRYFLYSEETEYARRVRAAGYRIRFVHEACVTHVGGASGSSTALDTLRAVNRVRDFDSCHGPVARTTFRAAIVVHHLLRAGKPADRQIAATMLSRRRREQAVSRFRRTAQP